MGLDNYGKIINENGNPSDIVIGCIGYGLEYQNSIFNDRISDKYYNFILNSKDIGETIPQGSRIAEILVNSTTTNIKILPLITVTEEGYTSLSSIAKALGYAVDNSDVICYELINKQHEVFDIIFENAFKKNIPICGVTSSEKENYPATHGMTIATSSLDRNSNLADYSGKGDYIDFTAPSTDVEEIFNSSTTISRWSGPEYSNAHIVSAIALIKTYDKKATILDVYNFLRNYCVDLGKNGKDNLYGYGCPVFKDITIKDIDKEEPQFKKVEYDNQNWETLKQLKFIAKDNIRMKSWAITKNQDGPLDEEWHIIEDVTPNLEITQDITENGVYYIWIEDIAENKVSKEIKVEKVDNKPPVITYTIDNTTLASGYVTINVTAEDTESGLYDSPFSWDKQVWTKENATKVTTANGRYKVYAVDNLGNISEQEIVIDLFPQEGTASLGEGDIISSVHVSSNWNGNINNDVQITLNNNLDISAWQLSLWNQVPSNFVELEPIEQPNNNNNNNTVQENTITESNTVENVTTNETVENTTTDNSVRNTVSSRSINSEREVIKIAEIRRTPIVINVSLQIDVTYYLWIRDSQGNMRCQTFTISKPKI